MPDSRNEENLKAAEALVNDGRAKEAIPIYEETLADLEMLYGEEGLELSQCLLGLGLAYDRDGRLNDSLRVYTRALRLARRLIGEPDEVVVDILTKLIEINEALGRPADALTFCEQAVTEAQQCLPKNSRKTQNIVDRYHHFANLAGRREQAMPGQQLEKSTATTGSPAHIASGEDAADHDRAENEAAAASSSTGRSSARRPAPPPIKANRGRAMQEADNKQATIIRLLKDYSIPAIGVLTVLVLVGFFITHPPQIDPAIMLRNAANAGKLDMLYRTAEDSKKLRLTANNEATLATGASGLLVPYVVTSPDCQGLLPALIASVCEKQIWMDKEESQIKSEDGTAYYAADGPEALIVAKMARLAGNAQGYFLRTGEYPKAVTPDIAPVYSYQNPLDGKETPVTIKAIMDSGSGTDNTQETLESGGLIAGEDTAAPCRIVCYAVLSPFTSGNSKGLKTTKFFVRGSDRDGKWITTSAKKVFVILPSDANLNAPEPATKFSARGGETTKSSARSLSKSPAKSSARRTKPARKQGPGSASGAAVKSAAGQAARPEEARQNTGGDTSNQPASLSLELNVQTESPVKKTRMWIVSKPPCPLVFIHYGLPMMLFGLSIITFIWSRMTGADMRGRETASGNNFALILSAVFLVLTVLALAAQVVIFG